MKKNLQILVIDDEEIPRQALAELLDALDCKVVACANPKDVINTLEKGTWEFDVLFTDRRMPKMWGEEVIRRAKLLKPYLRVVLVTGDSLTNTDFYRK